VVAALCEADYPFQLSSCSQWSGMKVSTIGCFGFFPGFDAHPCRFYYVYDFHHHPKRDATSELNTASCFPAHLLSEKNRNLVDTCHAIDIHVY
jgi:hypothetical protein